ncbi:MAG: hypothetical protein ACREV5_08380 [Steroidobacter sp.]
MNTFKKFSMGVVLGVLALTASAAPSSAAEVFGVALPDLSAVTAEVSKFVAREVTSQLRNALNAPRQTRVRQSPSVTIVEAGAVVVEATRLPALDGADDRQIRTAQVRL